MNEDGYRRLHVLDAHTLAPRALPTLPASDNLGLSGVSRDGRTIQLTYDRANQPPAAIVFDWKTRKLTRWTLPTAPEVDVAAFASVSLESFPAHDGTPMPMFVRRPPQCVNQPATAAPCPVVVQFHGGPEAQALPLFSPWAQLFVDAGFVFVEPNVRGSTGYGRAWLHADDGPGRAAVVTDIEDCARYLRTPWARGGVAPKLGVYGRSYGGYSSLMAMTRFAGAFDVGVAEVGIANLVSFLDNTAPYRRILRTSEYGDPARDHDALVALGRAPRGLPPRSGRSLAGANSLPSLRGRSRSASSQRASP